MTFELRPYQIDGLASIWDYFKAGKKGNPVIAWPCGVGKSIVPAVFIKHVMATWPDQRFLVMVHVKELIEQNFKLMKEIWPNAPAGIYSAGLKQKDFALPIIFGGIQSMTKDPKKFGHRDIIFIDEGHLVNQDQASMYQKFIAVMKSINPLVKIIGMTATPFRMGQGLITDNGLFTDIVHDITEMSSFNKLIEENYLSLLIPQSTKTQLDVSNVGIQKGEFIASQLQTAVDKNEITMAGLRELVEVGQNRKSWLIFSSGIEHSDHIAEMLGLFGIDCASVHSKQTSEYNDDAIKAFKNFEVRAICNYGKLTTGFNHPAIDLIGMFRPTLSIPLWVQMLGRGTRPAEGKNNCVVLDFANNTPRLGCINDPVIPKKKGERGGDAPIKLCEQCGAYNHASVRFCCQCGSEFHFKVKIVATSGTEELVKGYEQPVIETFEVGTALYNAHSKIGQPTSLKATYFTGMLTFKEYVCLEHGGYAKRIAHQWWMKRHNSNPPATVAEALNYISEIRCPKKIRVHMNKKYPEILSVEF